jgi:GNAT superfamily N-acetyltransferase
VGLANIEAHDMVTRPQLTPWLSGVYVLPGYRQRGVGSALVQAVVAAAGDLGLETLYLFTPDRVSFYHRMGWRDLERVRYRGEEVVIMAYDLCPAVSSSTSFGQSRENDYVVAGRR